MSNVPKDHDDDLISKGSKSIKDLKHSNTKPLRRKVGKSTTTGTNGRKRNHSTGNIFRFLLQEVNHSLNVNEVEEDEDENSIQDYELEQLINMFSIPLHLEKFMLLTLLASFDCYLYYFTILPIRLVHGVFLDLTQASNNRASRTRKERLIMFLIITASILLTRLDTSKVYHNIKRQSAVKLYMLYSVLDMGDKMLATLGQSLLSVVLSIKGQKRIILQKAIFAALSLCYLVAHGYVLIYQTVSLNVAVNSYSNSLLTLLLSIQFSEMKSSVFKKFDKEGLFQISISDVVERFQVIVFLMIISIRNLVARAGSIATVIPTSWTLHTTSSVVIGVLCGPMVSVIGSELIVDWAKHAYIIKFNRMRPRIYRKFFYIIYKDHVAGLQKYQDRLGLPLPALTVLFLVMIRPAVIQALPTSSILLTFLTVIGGFLFLVILKYTTHLTLLKWGKSIRKEMIRERIDIAVTEREYVPGQLASGIGKVDESTLRIIYQDNNDHSILTSPPPTPTPTPTATGNHTNIISQTLNEKRKKKDDKNPRSLEDVTRYKMVSKQIW
ncbi:hypothetical protein Kpol_526p21 [Vanderwaltozyma polyspora DSM 70294]|uniref:Uncharacterized protein n=1 Tax=Vanderwaltozyma polyspora (strain ATCC 22028 / DSM 70294 / BCRC 21397 / CBS 2163 / NBRC 10782 / NRRL Y-8283 / UCD 57-17) TaxID=436907 RepID=A7TLS6_VANPO|nr:uncharacterized protein Kpol_526p21 [Vanderwaltozyma polyspora DSM 70294]EDO16768.1 hypothetical protein Kpol_526p21 [Vanderwaltozyma polyspora DSM 70294]